MSRIGDNVEIIRSSELIGDRTRKMSVPYISSSLCVSIVSAVDALVAGAAIGADALAAVAAAAPLLAVDPILHCLFGFGIDKLMIRAVGKGKRKEADRIFGTVLITVLLSYLLLTVPLIVFGRQLIAVNIKNPGLAELIYQYSIPRLAAMGLLELCLCCERAFRVDGRAVLFSVRSIVVSVLNVLLDVIMIVGLGLGVRGLAWATVISAFLGFTVSLSHFFSRKRTVLPDLSVILSPKEMWGYIKADVRLGSSATLDELLETLLINAQTGAISALGGASALAVWSVYKAMRSIVVSLGNGISASVSVHAGLLFGEKDYDGVRYSVKSGASLAHWNSLGLAAVVVILAGPIADLYGISPELRTTCMQCLRIGCFAFPAVAIIAVFSAYLPAVDKVSLASTLVVVQKVLPLLAAVIARSMSLQSYFRLYVIAVLIGPLILEILKRRDGSWFVPEQSHEMISSYSIPLDAFHISAASSGITCDLRLAGCTVVCSLSSSLVVEESLNYILRQNPDTEVRADIKLARHEGGVQITVIDDGKAYSPISHISRDTGGPEDLEEMIVSGLTMETGYDRMLDLNHLTMYVAGEPEAATAEGSA